MSTLNPYFYAYNPELLAFENAWINFVKIQEINTSIIKPEVCESWQRCFTMGMDPLSKNSKDPMTNHDINQRLENNNELMKIVTPFMDSIYNMIEGTGFRVYFNDSEGYVLRSFSDLITRKDENCSISFLGANISENIAGTNSAGLALITGKPIQIAGAEHYLQSMHKWSGSSAPIKRGDGKIIGVISLISSYELFHFHTLALVASAAKAIENEIYIQEVNKRVEESNIQLRTTLETITDGVVYIAKDVIMEINRELCTLIGKEAKEVIGKNVYEVIETIPNLVDMLNVESDSYHEGEIILKGSNKSYKCLFAFKGIDGSKIQNTEHVLIFTRVEEIESLAKKIKYQAEFTFDNIISESSSMKNTIDMAQKASRYDSRVIIEGESGTGKEMIAQAIHNNSYRKYGPFVAIDCGTLSKGLMESELFGYEGGAFTGSQKGGKKGLLELADKGTLFFDEIGNMPLEMQVKLLRVLQEGSLKRVGGITPIYTDARVIAATNVKLTDLVQEGNFREDLYYRLNVFSIKIPPLRDRKEDIPFLVNSFLIKNKLNKGNYIFEENAIKLLQEYDWPGNVRQLENAIERSLIMSTGEVINVDSLPLEISRAKGLSSWLDETGPTLEEKTREYIQFILRKNNNNITKTAAELNVSRSKVYKYIKDENVKNRKVKDDI